MKYLVVIAVVLLVLWLWRSGRREEEQERRADAARRPEPAARVEQQEMIRCPVCSVHLPRTDALPGPDGQLYCCAEHRSRGEASSHAEG
jgi:uncharacterized protein